MSAKAIVVAVLASAAVVAIVLAAILMLGVKFSPQKDATVTQQLVGCYGGSGAAIISIDNRYVTVFPSGQKTAYTPVQNSDGVSALPKKRVVLVSGSNGLSATLMNGRPEKLRLATSGEELIVVFAGDSEYVARLPKAVCE